MGKLSELVKRDYDAEVEIIREAGGSLWPRWIGLSIAFVVILGIGLIFGDPWSKRDIAFAMIFIVGAPFVERIWERYKVAAEMRHQRQVRVEVKLDTLLGLINIKDVDGDE